MNTLEQGQQALAALHLERGNRYYPGYHLAPLAGWMNDPNGLIYFNDRYHAFYQHHPFGVDWGPMHWGHATSEDMLHWQHQPIAIAPDSEADSDGCFSGSAVVDNGQLALIYTGHRWLGEVGDDSQICEVQCLATSKDGLTFEKHGVILTPPEGIMHFRDPKVWFESGSWWMVVGARDTQQQGQVLLYKGSSLTSWTFDRVLAQAKPGEGYMWECPDFFKLDQHHYLMCSPQGMAAEGERYNNLYQSGTFAGHWSPGNDFTEQQPFVELDHGHDFYAPQSFIAADGRRIIMAWMDMWESQMPSKEEGWCGSFTLPRELTEEEGQLHQRPIRELHALRGPLAQQADLTINGQIGVSERVESAEVSIRWHNEAKQEATAFGLTLGKGLTLTYHVGEGMLSLTRDYPELGLQDVRRVSVEDVTQSEWQIYFDRSSIEVFINDGRVVLSSRIYPADNDRQLSLFTQGGELRVEELNVWSLRSAVE